MRTMTRLYSLWWSISAVVVLLLVASLGGAQARSPHVHQRVVRMPSPWGERKVAITWSRAEPGTRRDNDLPLLVALHGRGESQRGPDRGFLGWVVDYGLPDVFGALQRGRLTDADYNGWVRADHLVHVNQMLRVRPFGGVFVVTPFTPDLLAEPVGSPAIVELGQWIAGELLTQTRARFSAATTDRARTAIDGVSLGGRLALEIGFANPRIFGAVGATQPAIEGRESALADRAAAAEPRPHIRLLSSDQDPLLASAQTLSKELRARGVSHALSVAVGPHNARFNRGPGGLEMLLHYDRELGRR